MTGELLHRSVNRPLVGLPIWSQGRMCSKKGTFQGSKLQEVSNVFTSDLHGFHEHIRGPLAIL